MRSFLGVPRVMFSIFNIEVTYYGFLIALGILCGIGVAFLICKIKKYDMNIPINVALFAVPLAIIGARLYYFVLHGNSFTQFFNFRTGGLAIYGAVIGGFLGVVVSSLIFKYNILKVCDIAAPCLILGQAIGRIGCYFSGCCYGVETTSEFFKNFPFSIEINGTYHLATMLYESLFNFLTFIALMVLTKNTNKIGLVTSGYLISYGTIRGILENFRDPSEALTVGHSIRASQLLSIILVIIGTILLFLIFSYYEKKKEKKYAKV